jgi:hypothetical protein
MTNFKRGWALTGQSWRALRGHGRLILFPLYGAVCVLVLVAPLAGPGAWLADRGDTVPGVALIAAGLYVAAFVTTFFGVALAASADRVLRGESAGMGYGFGVARSRLGAIAGWALLTATVSAAIRVLESRSEIAQIVAGVFGAAWSVVTLLALPVVAMEGLGPIAALKRSAQLFRQRWGGQLGGMAAIGIAVLLFGMLPSIALVVGGVAILSGSGSAGFGAGAALVALGVAGFGVSGLIGSALRQVFAVALYRFAEDGEAIGNFSADDLEGAVRTRGRGVLRTA